MKINCAQFSKKTLQADLLCLPVLEDQTNSEQIKTVDDILRGQLRDLIKSKLFTGKGGESHLIVVYPKQSFRRLLLIGLGKKRDLEIDAIRKAAGIAGQLASRSKAASIAFVMPEIPGKPNLAPAVTARAVVEGINLGSYNFNQFKSSKENGTKVSTLTLLVDKQSEIEPARIIGKQGLVLSDMQNLCRDLAGSPSNVATPTYLVNQARLLSKQHKIKITVLGRTQIEKLKMGAFLSVAKGSAEPPYLIRLDYRPKIRPKKKVILVGKGITFDTGGITLKPGADMHEMKQDMTGAAVVMCTLAAAAQLKASVQITGFIPTCENMPGSRAYKPGDVLTTSIGKTIEVISTDAEGRLLLADVLGYAAKMKPDYLIDVATLTGAVIVALGHVGSAMMSTSDDLLKAFHKASLETGEKVWQLPLWPEYEHQIKSPVADMKNSGGRPGGAIVAATILKQFVGDTPWLHLDIAGMDLEYRGTEYTPKGASGYGVRLLTQVLTNLK